MRIAQAGGPDLLAGAVDAGERIVVRDAVAAVLAHRAGRGVVAQVGNDAQDLADDGVEPLRVEAADVLLLAAAASPTPMYMTRQSGSPGRAAGLNVISPSGWMGDGSCIRNNSRAVPSNVAFADVAIGPLDRSPLHA